MKESWELQMEIDGLKIALKNTEILLRESGDKVKALEFRLSESRVINQSELTA